MSVPTITWTECVEAWAEIGWKHPWLVGFEEEWQQALVNAVGSDPGATLDALLLALGDTATQWCAEPVSEATPGEPLTDLKMLWASFDGQVPEAAIRSVYRRGWTPVGHDYAYTTAHQITAPVPASPDAAPRDPVSVMVGPDLFPWDLAKLGGLHLAGWVKVVSAVQPAHCHLVMDGRLKLRVAEVIGPDGQPTRLSVDDAGWEAPTLEPVEESFAERLTAIARTYQVMRFAYGYPDLVTAAWPDLLDRAVALADTDGSAALMVFVRALRDRHCNLQSSAVSRAVGQYPPPFQVLPVEGHVVIVGIEPEIENLEVGDVIVTVDGVPIGQRLETAARWRMGSGRNAIPASGPSFRPRRTSSAHVATSSRWDGRGSWPGL